MIPIIGPKHIAIAKLWLPVASIWGAVGFVALVHVTDWERFLKPIPYIKGKFQDAD